MMPSILAPEVKHQDEMCPHLFNLWNQLGPQPHRLRRNLTINFQIRGYQQNTKIVVSGQGQMSPQSNHS